jgi:hypothetical protein
MIVIAIMIRHVREWNAMQCRFNYDCGWAIDRNTERKDYREHDSYLYYIYISYTRPQQSTVSFTVQELYWYSTTEEKLTGIQNQIES